MGESRWPRIFRGRWVSTPLHELGAWADTAHGPMVAVPVDVLTAASRWRECSQRTMLKCDEDGPLRTPVEIVCRRQQGHDLPGNPDHIRQHSNGYATWAPTPAPHDDASGVA